MKEDPVASLVKHRLEQARVTLDDARCLLDGQRGPASIINRSYYAMFYAALALMQKSGKAPTKHAGVIRLVDMDFVRSGRLPRELSKDLHKAFEMRQRTDYKIIQSATPEQAREIWEKARRFVEAVEQYLQGI